MATFLLHKDTTLHVTRIRYSYIFAKTLYCLPMFPKKDARLLKLAESEIPSGVDCYKAYSSK